MKSGKQKRIEIKNARKKRAQKKYERKHGIKRKEVTANTAPCNASLLAPNRSYSDPPFVHRGYYCDILFKCHDCRKQEVWSATRQKWWYEVAKGDVWTTAVRCNSCRRKERERRAEARKIHLEGIARKEMQRAEQAKSKTS
jgi:putative zinc ribbon protein